MSKSLVAESVSELFDMAERDIMNVDSLVNNPKHPIDLMHNIICFHATQANRLDNKLSFQTSLFSFLSPLLSFAPFSLLSFLFCLLLRFPR